MSPAASCCHSHNLRAVAITAISAYCHSRNPLAGIQGMSSLPDRYIRG
ncbi:MAG: hypothetical protein QM278_00840 [Pseudomonadota bacterium]|nr:hypothetical protein [Pseudomonadota bacterium]